MAVAERELITGPKPWRCTRELFYRMGELGLFEGQRVILMEGEIIQMPPIGPPHAAITTVVRENLAGAFGESYFVREQSPFDIGADTDPEPDIAVIRGKNREFIAAHPAAPDAALIVEVSASTLAYDRREKGSLYARAGVADYWIINLEDGQLEIHRRPVPDPAMPFGFGYAGVTIHRSGETVAPLEVPRARIAVADLLP